MTVIFKPDIQGQDEPLYGPYGTI